MTISADLVEGDLELTGRILPASNATFQARIGSSTVVYKPVAGERPLWDFPDGTLAGREVAAYEVSLAFGGDLVPPTWLREGPHGIGMVQQWCEPDSTVDPITLVDVDSVPDGWLRVIEGLDADDRPVALVHEDTAALRRMAVFDVIVNNADRKGGHVLPLTDGRRFGVDHGLTFHVDHKLRTVLWGWVDQPLTGSELAAVADVRRAIDDELGERLESLITALEIESLADRCDRLSVSGTFPGPSGPMPAVPWPPF